MTLSSHKCSALRNTFNTDYKLNASNVRCGFLFLFFMKIKCLSELIAVFVKHKSVAAFSQWLCLCEVTYFMNVTYHAREKTKLSF